jgi:hypothetical protein
MRNQTRYVCNFFERHLPSVDVDGFDKICFVCKNNPTGGSFVNSSKALIVELPFDRDNYLSLSNEELPEYFLNLLFQGFAKVGDRLNLGDDWLRLIANSFREAGYKNEWVYANKIIKSARVHAVLRCVLSIDSFQLNLEIYRDGHVDLVNVLRTIPDEVVYSHMFSTIKYESGCVKIYDRFGNSVYDYAVAADKGGCREG